MDQHSEDNQDAVKRRRNYIFAMEAMAIVLCAGVLFVSMTIARGLGGGALEWVAKIFTVILLGVSWWAIPKIYEAFFSGDGGGELD